MSSPASPKPPAAESSAPRARPPGPSFHPRWRGSLPPACSAVHWLPERKRFRPYRSRFRNSTVPPGPKPAAAVPCDPHGSYSAPLSFPVRLSLQSDRNTLSQKKKDIFFILSFCLFYYLKLLLSVSLVPDPAPFFFQIIYNFLPLDPCGCLHLNRKHAMLFLVIGLCSPLGLLNFLKQEVADIGRSCA